MLFELIAKLSAFQFEPYNQPTEYCDGITTDLK